MNKWKRNKIITTIGWVSVITSIPWIIGASVIVTKFNDQRQIANKSKLEKEQSKTKNKQLDTKIKKIDNKIKTLEIEKQISTKHINQLKNKNIQQEIVHNEWYVKNSQAEIKKMGKKINKLEKDIKYLWTLDNSNLNSIDTLTKSSKQYLSYHQIVEKISPPELWEEILDITRAKDILDKVVSTITKQTTRLPTDVIYSSFKDFIKQTTLSFEKKDLEKLKKVSIKVKVQKNDDDFQIVTLMIQKKGKTVAESNIKVFEFKSTSMWATITAAKSILDKLNDTTTTNKIQSVGRVNNYANLDEFFNTTTLPTPNNDDLATLERVKVEITAIPDTLTSHIVTFTITISKRFDIIATSTVRVRGFIKLKSML